MNETPKPLTAAQHVGNLVLLVAKLVGEVRRLESSNKLTDLAMDYIGREDVRPVLARAARENVFAGIPAVNAALNHAGFKEVTFQGLTEFVQEIDRDATPATPPTVVTLPVEMTPAMREVLGLPNFMCSPFAEQLRLGGHEIPRKAEEEQAAVIWWLLPFAVAHGEDWRPIAVKSIPGPLKPKD